MASTINFESSAYSVSAIQKAAYRGSPFLTIDIKVHSKQIVCELQKTLDCSNDEYFKAIEEFKKDALDYVLREKIATDTEAVRNVILGLAFSKSGLVDE